MELQTALSALVLIAAFFVKGVSGFGPALVATPILVVLWGDARLVVPVFAPLNLIINVVFLVRVWDALDRRAFAILATGTVVGVPFGTTLLEVLEAQTLSAMVGVTVVASVIGLELWKRRRGLSLSGVWRWVTGFGAGAFGGALGAAVAIDGPPYVVYLQALRGSKTTQYATLLAVFTASGLIRTANYAYRGLLTTDHWIACGLALPIAWMSMEVGHRVFRRLSGDGFDRAVRVILLAVGISAVILSLV